MTILKFRNGYLEGFTLKLEVSHYDSKTFVCAQAVRQALLLIDQLNLSGLSEKIKNSNFVISSNTFFEDDVVNIDEV